MHFANLPMVFFINGTFDASLIDSVFFWKDTFLDSIHLSYKYLTMLSPYFFSTAQNTPFIIVK